MDTSGQSWSDFLQNSLTSIVNGYASIQQTKASTAAQQAQINALYGPGGVYAAQNANQLAASQVNNNGMFMLGALVIGGLLVYKMVG